MRRPYFPFKQDAPEPLRAIVRRRVRFEEVDPLGIVWHGRYPGYFEDARVALGEKYGIGYLDFYQQGVVTPIKKMHINYIRPLKYAEEFTVEAIMHWTEAARMNIEYIIRNNNQQITTTGYTVQLFMDIQQNLLFSSPPFYMEFCERWKAGKL